MDIVKLILLSIACGAISMVITKSPLLNKFHEWLEKRSTFLEEMLSCPWCTSHWVAAVLTLIYRPLILSDRLWVLPIDFVVTVFIMAALSSITARLIWSAYKPIMG